MAISQSTHAQSDATRSLTRALASDPLDFEVLKAFDKVKSDDGSDILVELIDLYLQGTSQSIIAMRKAADEAEWAQLKRAAHTLKGSSSTLGLRQIAKTCQDMEAASSNSTGDVSMLISLLESEFLDVKRVLIEERNRRLVLSH
jgi:HPt (histidine-containing phosphotransfer) domain-containing protein